MVCVCVCVVRYQHIEHMQNLQTTAVDCWSIWTSALKYVLHVATCAETQAARCSWHCQSAADQSCPIHCYDFYKKCHNYVTVQRIFNRFCQHQITISWHIHLQIFAESFIKFVQKLWEIYRKTNVSLFFRTQCICIWSNTNSSKSPCCYSKFMRINNQKML